MSAAKEGWKNRIRECFSNTSEKDEGVDLLGAVSQSTKKKMHKIGWLLTLQKHVHVHGITMENETWL